MATRRADENIKKFITRKTKKRKGKESWIYINGTIDDTIFFYDLLKLKKAGKCKKYVDQHCYVACFVNAFLSRLKAPSFVSLLKPLIRTV